LSALGNDVSLRFAPDSRNQQQKARKMRAFFVRRR